MLGRAVTYGESSACTEKNVAFGMVALGIYERAHTVQDEFELLSSRSQGIHRTCLESRAKVHVVHCRMPRWTLQQSYFGVSRAYRARSQLLHLGVISKDLLKRVSARAGIDRLS
jgi:hypothetical protein